MARNGNGANTGGSQAEKNEIGAIALDAHASDTQTLTIYVGSTAPQTEEQDPNFPDGHPEFDEIFGNDFNFDEIWD
ncbi:hypothetical protein NUACC21_01860 [Scytonema sp. NUACC21]